MPTIIHEDDLRWNVECEESGCHNVITVPKRWTDHLGQTHTADAPDARRCVSHPPTL